MSRLRTGHEPGAWLDIGPAVANARSAGAVTVGFMNPVVRAGVYLENRHRRRPRHPLTIRRQEKAS